MLKLMLGRYEEDSCIRDLGKAWAFSGSEANSYFCPRFWSYYYMENIRESSKVNAATLGTAFHSFIERILKKIKEEDRLITKEDVSECMIELESEVYLMALDAIKSKAIAQEKSNEMMDYILRASEGIRRYWNDMLADYRVMALEEALRCPIFEDRKFTSIFNPEMHLLRKVEGEQVVYKPPKTGEAINVPDGWELLIKKWDWYRIGRADLILQDRHTNNLIISDHKTSASPGRYIKNIDYQTQLAAYSALLSWEMDAGKFQHWNKDWDIVSGNWNVFQSKVSGKPKPLKSGKFSTAKNKFYQSWVFEEAIKDSGLNIDDYSEHIQWLKDEVNHKYAHNVPYDIQPFMIGRSITENLAYAEDLSRVRGKLATMDRDDTFLFSKTAVRKPQCHTYNSCMFSNNCLQNNTPSVIIGEEGKLPKIYWTNKTEEIP